MPCRTQLGMAVPRSEARWLSRRAAAATYWPPDPRILRLAVSIEARSWRAASATSSTTRWNAARLVREGTRKSAQLSDELQSRGADLLVGCGWIEIVERSDVPAHWHIGPPLCGRSEKLHCGGADRAPRPVIAVASEFFLLIVVSFRRRFAAGVRRFFILGHAAPTNADLNHGQVELECPEFAPSKWTVTNIQRDRRWLHSQPTT